jgi:hydroxymethylbilane synthase
VDNSPGLIIGVVPARAEVRDALISSNGYTLMGLPEGARVGTSSLRRSAQLLALRPDLQIESLRGNVDTRLRKAMEVQYDAIVLAGAGLTRLGLEGHITEWLPLDVMLPAPGQGALAVQCATAIPRPWPCWPRSKTLLRAATSAERAFLSGLGGSCALPVAAYATSQASGARSTVEMTGLVASLDGRRVIHTQGAGDDPLVLGAELAKEAIKQGADEILSAVM